MSNTKIKIFAVISCAVLFILVITGITTTSVEVEEATAATSTQSSSLLNINSKPRPIWVLGHRCNNRGDVDKALSHGANGVEIDIRTDRDKGMWIVNHDAYRPNVSLSLEEYFAFQLKDKQGFCLLYLDIKTPQYDLNDLQWQVRNLMKKYNENFYVIYSVSSIEEAQYFGRCWCKGNEGINVDHICGKGAKDVIEWNKLCSQQQWLNSGLGNCWYAHGICGEGITWTIRLKTGINKGKEFRDGDGIIKKVGTWTIYNQDTIEDRLLNWNLDWIMCDGGYGDFYFSTEGVKNAKKVLDSNPARIRLATMQDNPFEKFKG